MKKTRRRFLYNWLSDTAMTMREEGEIEDESEVQRKVGEGNQD